MFYEILIGLCVIALFVWKRIRIAPCEGNENAICTKITNAEEITYPTCEEKTVREKTLPLIREESVPLQKHVAKVLDEARTIEANNNGVVPVPISTTDNVKGEDVNTPSALLMQQRAKVLSNANFKRESPPKERLTEFLEKTILNDDKIQTIIDNLSLNKSESDHEPQILDFNITPLVVKPVKPLLISDRALRLQTSIDNVSDRMKTLNDINLNKTLELERNDCDEDKLQEEKPFLKRLQKQPGFPTGLNFGSVIGELKNKTKNGGLKPVFRKFDADTVDNDSLNAAVDENKKVQIEDHELGNNILADRRNKLETAAQGTIILKGFSCICCGNTD
ncbi:hypothetical protein MSG28_005029 [Choristoneura fumiferana]|uniref:Uncharacterized protein n=1 Tax=Choristoneura fumiferana TaxID=7141 RepID=A0ACC0JPH6_CHOFU|nr:hypothetical protein MSG28_005029 [Choristoneura fumiferana]